MCRALVFGFVVAQTFSILAAQDADTFDPGGDSLDPVVFAAWLHGKAVNGSTRLNVAKGRYTVEPANGLCGQRHVCISSLSRPLVGVTLDFTGVTLVFSRRDLGGVWVEGCVRCVIHGLTTQYATHPTNQARITGFGEDTKTMYVEVDQGYPLQDWKDSKSFSCYVFGASTRNWKPGASGLSHRSIEAMGGRRFAVNFSGPVGPGTSGNASAGDRLGCRPASGAFAFQVHGCSASTFQDITLLGSPSFGFFQTHPGDLPAGEAGNHFNRLKILRPPKPAGATEEPLLAAGADGFHNSGVPLGPVIENCYFERMADDGIAIHGRYALIVEANSTSLVVQSKMSLHSSMLRVYDDAFRPAGKFQVASVHQLPTDYRPPGGQTESHTMPKHFVAAGPYSLLMLQPGAAVPAVIGFDSVVSDEGRSGNGFVLRNNTILDHRARGMLIKASHGLIEDNVINGSTLGGIIITPELYWGEADYVTNLTVRRNRIARVGYGSRSYGALALGAQAPSHRFATGYGHRDISITDNEFSDLDTTAIWISSVRNLTLARNTIRRQWLEPTWATCCPPYPLPASTVAWLTESSNVVVSDNCVSEVGPYAQILYNYTDSVIDSEVANGVRVCDGLWRQTVV